jgi:putative membrane protein
VTELADGEWHRPLRVTPLLKGGFALVAVLGVLIANLRERIIDFFIHAPGYSGDPVDWIIDQGWLPLALLIAIGVIAIVVGLFFVSWRMHTFRITPELVEVRSGVLFRTHRKARLDRIQSIDIRRPLFARIFGAARLDVQVAGQDGTVRLEYLGSTAADELRAEILRLASGVRAAEASGRVPADPGATDPDARSAADPDARSAAGRLIESRMNEFLAPELDPSLAAPESVLKMNPGRLIGSTVLSPTTGWFLVALVVVIVLSVGFRIEWALFSFIPGILGLGSVLVRRVSKFLRYSIAATPDGIRVGYGLLSTSNETLPPGRIHAISVSQPLPWRPFGWWTIKVNRAVRSRNDNQNQQDSIVLPVGTAEETLRVLGLLLPELRADDLQPVLASGFSRDRAGGVYTVSPRRAAVLRWFSWRRNGFAMLDGVVLLRRGAIWRELAIVPFARMQSVALDQGPLLRALRLASVTVHTVAGPISGQLGALDADDATRFLRDAAAAGVSAAADDRTHRWGAA